MSSLPSASPFSESLASSLLSKDLLLKEIQTPQWPVLSPVSGLLFLFDLCNSLHKESQTSNPDFSPHLTSKSPFASTIYTLISNDQYAPQLLNACLNIRHYDPTQLFELSNRIPCYLQALTMRLKSLNLIYESTLSRQQYAFNTCSEANSQLIQLYESYFDSIASNTPHWIHSTLDSIIDKEFAIPDCHISPILRFIKRALYLTYAEHANGSPPLPPSAYSLPDTLIHSENLASFFDRPTNIQSVNPSPPPTQEELMSSLLFDENTIDETTRFLSSYIPTFQEKLQRTTVHASIITLAQRLHNHYENGSTRKILALTTLHRVRYKSATNFFDPPEIEDLGVMSPHMIFDFYASQPLTPLLAEALSTLGLSFLTFKDLSFSLTQEFHALIDSDFIVPHVQTVNPGNHSSFSLISRLLLSLLNSRDEEHNQEIVSLHHRTLTIAPLLYSIYVQDSCHIMHLLLQTHTPLPRNYLLSPEPSTLSELYGFMQLINVSSLHPQGFNELFAILGHLSIPLLGPLFEHYSAQDFDHNSDDFLGVNQPLDEKTSDDLLHFTSVIPPLSIRSPVMIHLPALLPCADLRLPSLIPVIEFPQGTQDDVDKWTSDTNASLLAALDSFKLLPEFNYNTVSIHFPLSGSVTFTRMIMDNPDFARPTPESSESSDSDE